MPSRNTYHLTWGFSYLGRGVSLHGCSSKARPLLLTLDEEYLLTTTPPDLERGVAPLGPPAPAQPPLLGGGVGPPGHCPWPQVCQTLFFWAPKSLQMVTAAMKLKDAYSLEGKL